MVTLTIGRDAHTSCSGDFQCKGTEFICLLNLSRPTVAQAIGDSLGGGVLCTSASRSRGRDLDTTKCSNPLNAVPTDNHWGLIVHDTGNGLRAFSLDRKSCVPEGGQHLKFLHLLPLLLRLAVKPQEHLGQRNRVQTSKKSGRNHTLPSGWATGRTPRQSRRHCLNHSWVGPAPSSPSKAAFWDQEGSPVLSSSSARP